MGKRQDYVQELKPLLAVPRAYTELEQKVLANSNLPGPRANLELCYAFGDCFEGRDMSDEEWALLSDWARIPPSEASTNDPKVFLPVCAFQALGAAYRTLDEPRRKQIVETFKAAAEDERWRVREAVAMGFQRIGEKEPEVLRAVFDDWIKQASLSQERAILASLAHPPMLNDREFVRFCLRLTNEILSGLQSLNPVELRSEDYRILRKGLDYSISVFVAAFPEEGFRSLDNWAKLPDPEIKKILKSNLSKSRLAKPHGERVKEILQQLGK